MKKIITITILVLMTVFSLSAEEILKERHVKGDIYEGPATVWLLSGEVETGTYYYVAWIEEDGSDVISVYCFTSIEKAFNVWNMSRYSIESNRQIYNEHVEDFDGRLFLVRDYHLRNNK